ATWNAVTSTVTGGEVASGSISYIVKLYKNNNTEPICTETVMTGTEFDFSDTVGIYGKYKFTVQAVPTTDFTDLYISSSESELSEEYKKEDKDAPTIKSFTGEDGVLTAVANDNESGVLYYAFTTESDSSAITGWSQLGSAVVDEDATMTYTLKDNDHGTYYFHVKDADGNIRTASNTNKVTHIIYDKYYDATNKLHTKHSYVVGDTITSFIADPVRPGYVFEYWEDSNHNRVSPENIGAGSEVTITAKWTRSSTEITKQPTAINCDYDGENHKLEAAISSGTVGSVTWNWYKSGVETPVKTESGTSTFLNLRDVSESGDYYAVVTVVLSDGEEHTATANTDTVNVSIKKIPLSIVAKDITLHYGDVLPADYNYEYTATGLVPSDQNLLTGKFTSSYESRVTGVGDVCDIVEDSNNPFVANNYNLTITNGKVTVLPKEYSSDITVTLADSSQASVVYSGEEYKPAIIVKDGDQVLDDSDYTINYSDNINVGEATIKVDFQNNYSGSTSIHFNITKAETTAQVVFENLMVTPSKYVDTWEYGTIVTRPGGDNCEICLETKTAGDYSKYEYHFFDENNTELPVDVIPKAVGSYKVKVIASGSPNYFNAESEQVSFTITKRTVDIMITGGGKYTYDSEEHFFDQTYEIANGTKFAPGEDLADARIEGSGTEVGTYNATFIPVADPNTNLDNYIFNLVPDEVNNKHLLIISKKKLDTIDGLK
ncbi:MAG: hypothetical protein IKI04_02835, partial [Bacilli bacterium]|nr:hypothetical protein [Bacilli bacterium]